MIALLGKIALVVGPCFHHLEYFMPFTSGLKWLIWEIRWQSNWCSLVGTTCFSLVAFRILFLFKPCHFNYDVSRCRPLWVQIIWDSLGFLDLCVFFLHQIREFMATISSNRFLITCSLSSLSDIPMMWMLLYLSQNVLKLSSSSSSSSSSS